VDIATVSIVGRDLSVAARFVFCTIGAGASCLTPLGRLGLEAGIDQPPDNDLGRLCGVKDLRGEIAAAEEIG
jgi:hypothetical protein